MCQFCGWGRRVGSEETFLAKFKVKDLVDQIVVLGIFGHTV